MGAVEGTIQIIRTAAGLKGKRAIAMAAGLGDTILRGVEDADWNPRAATLIKLEPIAKAVVAEQEAAKS